MARCYKSKRFFLVSNALKIGEVAQAGALVKHQGVGEWLQRCQRRGPEAADAEFVEKHWCDYGDRKQEIVFIGCGSRDGERKFVLS